MIPVLTITLAAGAGGAILAVVLATYRRDRSSAAPADTAIRLAAGLTTVGLMGIAGAISYQHLLILALRHGQHGWLGHAFPLSVDGVEIVASLRLLADRRAHTRSGWLPWTALGVGALFSLFANIATAEPDPTARIIAGWPAIAFMLAVKLLSGLLDQHHPPAPLRTTLLPNSTDATIASPPLTTTPDRDIPREPDPEMTGPDTDEVVNTEALPARRNGHQLPIDLMRRIPIHHDGYRRWQTQWADLQTDNADTKAIAERHNVTPRHLAWVRAAGQAGWLDPPDPPAHRLAALGASPPTSDPNNAHDYNDTSPTEPIDPNEPTGTGEDTTTADR